VTVAPLDYPGALEAVERILNRGGEPLMVLRTVLDSLHARAIPLAAIRFGDGTELAVGGGAEVGAAVEADVVFGGMPVGSLALGVSDRAFVERVAALISPYVHAR
jgi:hypothetical protein